MLKRSGFVAAFVLTPGTGAEVAATSTVTVDYIGVACSTG